MEIMNLVMMFFLGFAAGSYFEYKTNWYNRFINFIANLL